MLNEPASTLSLRCDSAERIYMRITLSVTKCEIGDRFPIHDDCSPYSSTYSSLPPICTSPTLRLFSMSQRRFKQFLPLHIIPTLNFQSLFAIFTKTIDASASAFGCPAQSLGPPPNGILSQLSGLMLYQR